MKTTVIYLTFIFSVTYSAVVGQTLKHTLKFNATYRTDNADYQVKYKTSGIIYYTDSFPGEDEPVICIYFRDSTMGSSTLFPILKSHETEKEIAYSTWGNNQIVRWIYDKNEQTYTMQFVRDELLWVHYYFIDPDVGYE